MSDWQDRQKSIRHEQQRLDQGWHQHMTYERERQLGHEKPATWRLLFSSLIVTIGFTALVIVILIGAFALLG